MAALATFSVAALTAHGEPNPSPAPAEPRIDRQVLERLAADAARQADQQRALRAGPAAARARAASRGAFRGMSDDAAVSAAQRKFGEQVFDVTAVPSRAPEGLRHAKFLSPTSQLLVREDGSSTGYVATSTAPIAVPEDGDLRPLDLSLDRSATGFAPEKPMAPVRFGARVGDGLTFTAGGLRLVPRVANPDAPGAQEGDVVAYANADRDVDLYFSATQTGAKFSYVVRSPQAPERLAFDLDLPAGATTTVLPEGSIGVQQDGRTIATLQQPIATDADGKRLDVTATVADGQLVFTLVHQGKDLAYPLLVDPYWTAYWNWHSTGAGNGPWQPTEASGRFHYTTETVMGPWGTGMYVYQCCSEGYDLYQDGYWEFVAPGTSWIQQIDYLNLGHYDGGSAPGPYTGCQIAWLWSSDWTQQAYVPQMCATALGHTWTQCVSNTPRIWAYHPYRTGRLNRGLHNLH